ncbi:chitobiase/beta-hexosaminidase C-terminal domain-containing protein [Tunturiibacter psychrotolerans]|uniref:chitobiase/beta-hexosaminidase C-terminal domain-containing protein n=1 Tax=Tunturiibacter psychrotolerans TaxID=3069686 RepID=UPI003D1FCC97
MRFAIVSLPCLVLILAGCSSHNAPTTPVPAPTPVPTPAAATPTFSVAAGTYTAAQMVTIGDATTGATIYYTTNGSAPTVSSTRFTGPVTVSSTETLMATAIAPGYVLSTVGSALYTIAPPPPPPPTGAVLHGQLPLAGAHVYVFAANTTGYGKASVSLLEPALTGASDSIGAYVTTVSDGTFKITSDYTCTANTQVYLYALGGDPGSGNNPASGLLAVLGNCPNSGSFSTTTAKVTVNEVSTIATAYAIAGFATDATHVSSSGTPLAQTGIANAFANAANLTDLSTGTALTATPVGNGVVPQSEINTLADILAACVGAANSSSCSLLFENATADGTTAGTPPTDTATAAINVAHHPGTNVATLYTLAGASTAFAPALAAEPNDFTVALQFPLPDGTAVISGAGGGHPIAIDAEGSVWLATPNQKSVLKFSNSGALLSPAAGYTGGGLKNPGSIAIDALGNAWITNFLGNTPQPNGTVIEFSNSGTLLSPSNGFGPFAPSYLFSIAIDASDNAWVPYGDGIAGLSSAGVIMVAVANPAGTSGDVGIAGTAIDTSGNIWGALPFGSVLFNEFSMSGAIVNPPTAGQFSCGAPFEPEQEPEGVAIDASGDVWITSGQGFTKESKSPIHACSGKGGGINPAPEGVGGDIAIDGDGNAWMVNGALAEFSNSGVPISPSNGYTIPIVPNSIAPDGSGNLWVRGGEGANLTDTLVEMIGASAPVVTPIAIGVKNNTLGSRP